MIWIVARRSITVLRPPQLFSRYSFFSIFQFFETLMSTHNSDFTRRDLSSLSQNNFEEFLESHTENNLKKMVTSLNDDERGSFIVL